MKRNHWLRLGVAVLLLAASGWMLWLTSHRLNDTRETVINSNGCRVPVTRIEGMPGANVAIVVFHGLGANRRIMLPLSRSLAGSDARVYVLDLPGHGDNTDPFSFARAETCAAAVIEALVRRKEIQLERTVLTGHSMGGALAMKLADRFPTAATIAISPHPMARTASMPPGVVLPFSPPRRMPNNLLIFTGRFDLPFLNDSARKLVEMAGGERQGPEDFPQRRAVRWIRLPWATHTSLIFDYQVWRFSDLWWRLALPVEVLDHSFYARSVLLFSALGLLGMMLVFPRAVESIASPFNFRATQTTQEKPEVVGAMLRWAVAGTFAVSVLNFVAPLNFLRMYNGDYLASCLLVAGVTLCALLWKQRPGQSGPPQSLEGSAASKKAWRGAAVGALMGLGTMLAIGAWMNWALTDLWPNMARWIRFPVILLASLPYALAEEWALGALPEKWMAKARRWGHFIGLRLIVYLCMLLALFFYSSEQILIVVLLPFMGLFSILVRLGADTVRRRTGAVEGAAVFTAILMAWLIAAVFPVT